MRYAIACLGLLMGLSGWCADDPLQQRITYDRPAQRLKTLLHELSQQTQLKLSAAPPLDAETVLVAVQDLPLETLMAHLAEVMDGEWLREAEGVYRLSRTPKVMEARRRADREAIVDELRRVVEGSDFRRMLEPLTREAVVARVERIRERLRALVDEPREGIDLWSWHNELQETEWHPMEPQHRLLHRLIAGLDFRVLADIPLGERRVFSHVSGRYLLPLRVDWVSLLRQWASERAIFEGVLTDPRHQFTESDKKAMEDYWLSALLTLEGKRTPTRVYLEVIRMSSDPWTFAFLLYLADDEGRIVDMASQHLFLSGDREAREQWVEQQIQRDRTLGKPVEWRDETLQWLNAWQVARKRGAVQPLPELLDPAKYEPLRFVATDVLRSYARHREVGLVALLDDRMLFWNEEKSVSPQQLVHFLGGDWWQLRVVEGVLLVKPRQSSLFWNTRENRVETSRWVHRVVQRGYVSLEDSIEGVSNPILGDLYSEALVPRRRTSTPTVYRQYTSLLKLLAADVLAADGSQLQLPLNRLSRAQIQQLESLIYNHAGNNFVEASDDGAFVQTIDQYGRAAVPLPHAHLPNGLPPDATLRCFVRSTKGVLTERSGVGIWGYFFPMWRVRIALQDVNLALPEDVDDRDRVQNALLLPAWEDTMHLQVVLPPKNQIRLFCYSVSDLQGHRPMRATLEPVRLEQLPPEWLMPPETSEEP